MLRRSIFVSAATAALGFYACSDSNNLKAPPAEAGAVCPTSPKDAVGKACGPEGYACAVGYLCPGAVWQQAHCSCTGSKYACVDSTGVDVTAGTDPNCSPVPPPSENCGNAPDVIKGKVCNTAGFACYYVGVTCPNQNGGKPFTDNCLCAPHGPLTDGGPSMLTWRCEVATCL